MAEDNKKDTGFVVGGAVSKPFLGSLSLDPARGSPLDLNQGQVKFAAGQTLGRLVKWLRFMGFDAVFRSKSRPGAVDRILLIEGARPVQKAIYRGWGRIFVLSATDHPGRLKELIVGLPLSPLDLKPMTRCGLCNRLLEECPPAEVSGLIPDHVLGAYSTFRRCPECHRIYWPGTHYQRITAIMEGLFEE